MNNSQKDSFIFYKSFYEAIKKLKKKEQLTVYSQICEYVFEQKNSVLDGVPGAIFDLIKPQIDANLRRFENGKKGGRPKTKPKPNHNLDVTKPKPNENVNVNVNVNDNVNDNANENVNGSAFENPPAFIPSVDEVQTYITEQAGIRHIRPDFDANRFLTYYNARGWMAGNTRLKDWKALVDSWLDRSGNYSGDDDDEDPFGELKGSF